MLTINLVFILRKSVNYSVNLFSNRNMNSAIISAIHFVHLAEIMKIIKWYKIVDQSAETDMSEWMWIVNKQPDEGRMKHQQRCMDSKNYCWQVKVIKLQWQIVMHAIVMFHMNSDSPSTQLLQHCLRSKFFLGEPQFNRELELSVTQALLYLQQNNKLSYRLETGRQLRMSL